MAWQQIDHAQVVLSTRNMKDSVYEIAFVTYINRTYNVTRSYNYITKSSVLQYASLGVKKNGYLERKEIVNA